MADLSDDERIQFELLVAPLRDDLPPVREPRPRRRRPLAALRYVVATGDRSALPWRAHRRHSVVPTPDHSDRPRRSRPRVSGTLVVAIVVGLVLFLALRPNSLLNFGSGPGSPQAPPPPQAAPAEPGSGRLLAEVPVTSSGQHSFLHKRSDGSAIGFDPCRAIHWELNPRSMPDGADEAIHAAIDDVSARTGLRFVYDGETLKRIDTGTEVGRRPVLIQWSDAGQTPELKRLVAGFAAPQVRSGRDEADDRLTSGLVVLDAEDLREASPDQVRLVTQHELGHLVGLGHVDDPRELMYEGLAGQRGWGPGDLEGLAMAGSEPCS